MHGVTLSNVIPPNIF